MSYDLEAINTLFAQIAECMHRNPARAMRLLGQAKAKVREALERAALAAQPVPYPRREDVTPEMRARFERLFSEARKHNHGTLARNEQGTYRDLRVDADWIFYQRAWADALAAHKPDGGDAKDAERYRRFRAAMVSENAEWLESIEDALVAMGCAPEIVPTTEQVDAAFDAAMAQQRQGEGGAHGN